MSTSPHSVPEAVTVVLSSRDLYVDDRLVLEWSGTEALTNLQVVALEEALGARRTHHLKIATMGGPPFGERLLVIADKQLPYGRQYEVLEAATRSGFNRPMLLVLAW